MDDTQRGTGRTTRMIQEALREAREGKTVYIIVRFQYDVDDMFLRVDDMKGDGDWDVNFSINKLNIFLNENTFGSIMVVTPEEIRFDWDFFTVRGTGDGVLYFMDHRAIESRFREALEMLHRWDQHSIQETP